MSDHDAGHHHHDHGITEPMERWTADFWNERYSSSPELWSGNANAVVVAETRDLPAGRALDVGCGEGGDAFWLAACGWRVDGVDVSQVALDRAAGHARDRGPEIDARLTWTQRDVLAWQPPAATYDLVYLSFLHLPSTARLPVYTALSDAVAPRGTFLVVAHHPRDIEVVPRPPDPDLYFTPEDLVAELDESWEIVTSEARARPGSHPDGGDVTLHDTVLRAVRTTR